MAERQEGERLQWFARAAAKDANLKRDFLAELTMTTYLFLESGNFREAVFFGGAILFRTAEFWPERNSYCESTVELFCFWTDSAREMVVAWILCAKRLQLNKDVRRVISSMLWETRKDALHLPSEEKLKPGHALLPGQLMSHAETLIWASIKLE